MIWRFLFWGTMKTWDVVSNVMTFFGKEIGEDN